MPVPINMPATDLNINLPTANSFLQGSPLLWKILKVFGIGFVIFIAIALIVGLIIWFIKMLKPTATVQRTLVKNKQKSCKATKQEDIKNVYRYDEHGFHYIGKYLGQTSDLVKTKDKEVVSVLVGHKKFLPIPRVIHNFMFQLNFIYVAPKKSIKYTYFKKEKIIYLQTSKFDYDDDLKIYVASDHIGLPHVIMESYVKQVDKKYIHTILDKVHNVMGVTIETNPYVNAEIKRKQEYEEESENVK